MCIDRTRETIMEVFVRLQHSASEVNGLHHASSRQNPEHSVEVGVLVGVSFVQRGCQFFPRAGIDREALNTAICPIQYHQLTQCF